MKATSTAAFVFLAASVTGSAGQTARSDAVGERLEREIPRLLESGEIPGMSAAVVLDGGLAWSGAFGIADAATGAPVTNRTVFQAASLTKQVFAYAALRLADRGVFDLDTPLAEYLPYPRLEGEEGYEQITARHALSHSTGLPNWGGDHLELGFTPGDDYQYSGEGYVYLQRTLEHLTGQSLDLLVDQEVIRPLGLTDSWMFWRPEFGDRVAAGHDDWGASNGVQDGLVANAAWSFLTTASDYARLIIAIMDGEGLEDATWSEALEPQIQVASRTQIDTDDKLYWGLGWGIQTGASGRAIWQWGHNGGFRAYLIAFPDRRDAFVYFTNGDAGLSIARDLLGAVGQAAGWQDDEHWALTWLDYETHDSPQRVARRTLVRTFREQGVNAGLEMYEALRAEHPVMVNDPFSAGVGRALNGLGEREAALAVLGRNVELHPRSGNSLSVLGDVQLEAGRYREALATYTRVLEIRPGHVIATRSREWTQEVVSVLDDLPAGPGDPARFVGQYGLRRVTLEDGVLYYQREGNPRYRMYALGDDTFFLEGLGTFRPRFVGEAGTIDRIVGLYVDGNEDVTPRSP
jgi:CubicO group peptidase (beta-lactamase class C family)